MSPTNRQYDSTQYIYLCSFRSLAVVVAIVVAMVVALSSVAEVAAQQKTSQADHRKSLASESWRSTMMPIIENACLDCHTGSDADGSLDLEAFQNIDQVIDQRRHWAKIATRVRDRQMPPADGPELSDADRERFLQWIDTVLPEIACNHKHHAGPVTIRRLTRYEYANTVRDLLKIDYPYSGTFPADEVGYGFDNIGDVLSVSPLLMEKYLTAAENVSELLIFDVTKNMLDQTFPASEFSEVRGGYVRGAHMVLTTKGTVTNKVEVAVPGKYRIKVDAFGQQAGPELAKMAVSAGGKLLKQVEVKPDNSEEAELYEFVAKLDKGSHKIEVTFVNDFYNPKAANREDRDRNLGVGTISIDGPLTAPKPSAAEKAFLFALPGERETPRQCAEKIINLHAARAFRRPLYKDERQKLLSLFDLGIESGESFHGAMQLVVQAILVSPHFLYKIEAPVPEDGTPRLLSNYELATSLSYFLWSSMPDDRLFRAARERDLNQPAVIKAEVKRMMADPRSIALVNNFADQWLQLRVLQQVDPDPDLFPGFTDHLRESMLQETRLLLSDVIQKDAPLTTLLTADYTYVNKALARHYGWSTRGLKAREFTRYDLGGTKRSGLLSHASLLTLTSNPTRTSPVKRGKWVLENLLADAPPPALPDVPQLDSQEELKGTLRERMEQHRADPNCAACHYKMDAIGFALENFDAFGRYRESDDGVRIDSLGTLPSGDEFSNAAELQTLIADKQRQQFVRCLVEKLFIYAIGRGPQSSDDCLIEEIAKQAVQQNYRFSDIIMAIVGSQAFQSRSSPDNPTHQSRDKESNDQQNKR